MLFTDVRTRSLTQRRLKVDKTDVDNGPSGRRKSDCLLRLQHLPTYPRLYRPIPDVGPMLGIVIYLHIEGALYAQKSVPSWFLAVFDSKIDVC